MTVYLLPARVLYQLVWTESRAGKKCNETRDHARHELRDYLGHPEWFCELAGLIDSADGVSNARMQVRVLSL